jgi:photosystem II stability/assembly factor-like uncharacterized protein
MRFADGSRGWIGGWTPSSQTLYYYTQDGCATWQAIPLVRAHKQVGNESIWFVDPPQSVGTRDLATVLVQHFEPQGFELSTFSSPRNSNNWHEDRTQLQTVYDLRSTRDGAAVFGPSAFGVDFVDADFGVAEAFAGDAHSTVLLSTVDGGTTWSELVSVGR